MLIQKTTTLIIMTIIMGIMGCSHGEGNNPITQGTSSTGMPEQLLSIGTSDANGIYSGISLLGAYELILDAETMTADLILKRHTAIGESFIVSGLGFFTCTPCPDCLTIKEIDLYNDDWFSPIKVKFSLSHPFVKGIASLPPSASNRLDLDVFDVALVIVPQDRDPDSYPLTGLDVQHLFCWKPDGFTTELSSIANETAACPYFLVIDNSDGGTSTNNKFEMGRKNVLFDVLFNWGGIFDMYLTMGYGASAKKPQRLEPKYFIPEFNRKAAWKVEVIPPNGDDPPTSANTWSENDTTTEFPVTVKVYDWQIGAQVYSTPSDFENAPANNVYAASEVQKVSVEIPGMFNILKTMNTANSGNGSPGNPLIYTFLIANENGLESNGSWETKYMGLVKVTDERDTLAPSHGRDFIIHSSDGVNLYNYSMDEYATYQVFPVAIVMGG